MLKYPGELMPVLFHILVPSQLLNVDGDLVYNKSIERGNEGRSLTLVESLSACLFREPKKKMWGCVHCAVNLQIMYVHFILVDHIQLAMESNLTFSGNLSLCYQF